MQNSINIDNIIALSKNEDVENNLLLLKKNFHVLKFNEIISYLLRIELPPENINNIIINLNINQHWSIKELEYIVLDAIINNFIKFDNIIYLKYFNENLNFKTELYSIFLGKSFQLNAKGIVDKSKSVSDLFQINRASVLFDLVNKHSHLFNLVFDLLDNSFKTELLEICWKRGQSFIHNISDHILCDLSFKKHLKDILTDDHYFVKQFVIYYNKLNMDYDNLVGIFDIFFENQNKLQEAFSSMVENSIKNKKYNSLIKLSEGYSDRRKIFKILLSLDNKVYLERFIKLYKDDSEIKTLITFM